MHIEQDAEAEAAHKHRQRLCPCRPGRGSRAGLAVQSRGQMPGSRCSQRDGQRGEHHLHDAENAGVGVAVDNIPHGIGDKQPRHKDHQCADNGRVRTFQPPQPRRRVGRQRHQARGQYSAEKRVGLLPVHKARHQTDDQTDQSRPQAVRQRAAEHQAEPQSHQHIAQIEHAGAVGPAGRQRLPQPCHGLIYRRFFRADAPAQRVQLLQLLQIVAVKSDTPHDHQRLAVGRLQADGHTVGNGKHLALHAIRPQNTVDGILHPKRLRPGHGQMISHCGRQIGQQIVVHTHLLHIVKIGGLAATTDSIGRRTVIVNGREYTNLARHSGGFCGCLLRSAGGGVIMSPQYHRLRSLL